MAGEAWQCALPDEGRVGELALMFPRHLHTPLVIYLRGELGAGKTTFARALIQALGYPGRVKSPSYGLLEPYTAGGIDVLHLDLYRIEDPGELDYLAIRDLFGSNSLLLVEWPEKGREYLPRADLDMHFDEADGQRFVRLTPGSGRGEELSRAVKMLFLD